MNKQFLIQSTGPFRSLVTGEDSGDVTVKVDYDLWGKVNRAEFSVSCWGLESFQDEINELNAQIDEQKLINSSLQVDITEWKWIADHRLERMIAAMDDRNLNKHRLDEAEKTVESLQTEIVKAKMDLERTITEKKAWKQCAEYHIEQTRIARDAAGVALTKLESSKPNPVNHTVALRLFFDACQAHPEMNMFDRVRDTASRMGCDGLDVAEAILTHGECQKPATAQPAGGVGMVDA